MNHWKKWAALLTACAMCLGTLALPASALEEDTAETSDAETLDSEEFGETTEEESTREEAQEEIEITPEQVTTYMTQKNTLDGITFYTRPEDYEDTISDEDVVDLLDDIELAGIDEETGEVVCTLEEEDDTDDFVIFLSEEGRWLVYMDTEYNKVIQVREIVSLLDNEYLFLSPDHKTLELYNDDYDELERSYTSDGKAEDGQVTYTNEDGWKVVLSSSFHAVISSARFVTENDNLALYVDDDTAVIGLYDKRKDTMWWSTPENVGHDTKATNTIVDDLSSSLKLVYGEPDARSTTNLRSKSDAKIKIKDTSDGVEITYTFKKAGITVPVAYTLEDDYLEARIDTEDIEEEDTSDTGKVTTSLSIMSSFGAASSTDTGYFVIPDGSGALINFNNGKTSAKSYTGYVYGSDVTSVSLTEPAVTEQVSLPMYGIVNGDNAMMVVCTEGDSNAKLTASVSGQSKSSYNVCGFDFVIRDSDTYYMSGDTSTALTVFEDGDIKTDAIALRYYPLDTEDTPDYADVAEAYRNYLIEEDGVTVDVESDDPSLYINFYGGVEKEKSILGVPVNLKTSLTSFQQAQEILGNLGDNGAEQIRVQYYNWTNAGITGKVDVKAKAAHVLGGNSDWQDLLSYASENDITIYPAVDNETFQSGNGYYTFTDTTVRISGSYARIYAYNLAFGGQDTSEKALSLLSPETFTEVYEKLTRNYTKKNLTGVSLGIMTSALYGDYGKKSISRDKAQQLLEESYQTITDGGLQMLADSANAYALQYVTELTNIPLQSSGFDVFDEDIPFYQMVMHGVKSYGSTAINASANPNETLLLAVASGSSLQYDLIAEETSTLKDTTLDSLYYASADTWTVSAAQGYCFSKAVLGGLGKETITDYVREDNIITTTYSNGTEVVTDLDAETVTVDGTVYALADYLEEGGYDET
jgi:regulation of enolase protein 1 (concanavalin A-like superfamily)